MLGLSSPLSSINVVKGNGGCLLSCNDCLNLGLVCLNEAKLVNSVVHSGEMSFLKSLFAAYPKVFSEKLGKLKGFQAKLSIDPNVKPVRQKHRHVPHHLKAYVTEKILKMIEDYVLEFATDPMPRISPFLALPKPGHDGKAITDISQIRIVADIQLANTAIQREHRVTLTPEGIGVRS